MFQGVTPCATLQYVSDIGVTAFMWSKFRGRKRKYSSHEQDQILKEKNIKFLAPTRITSVFKESLHLCPFSWARFMNSQ